jgi:hypothetical protein
VVFSRTTDEGRRLTDAQVLREAAARIEAGGVPQRSGDRVGTAVALVLAGDPGLRRRMDVRAVVGVLRAHNRDFTEVVYDVSLLLARMRQTAEVLETHRDYDPFDPPEELILGEVEDGCE